MGRKRKACSLSLSISGNQAAEASGPAPQEHDSPMSPEPKELVARVTRWTLAHPDERDPWEKAPAMSGVLAWNDAVRWARTKC